MPTRRSVPGPPPPADGPRTLTTAIVVAATAAAAGLLWLVHPPVAARPLAFLLPACLAVAAEGARRLGRRPATIGFVAGFVGNLALVHWVSLRAGVLAWVLLALVGGAWWALLAELLAWSLRRRTTTVLAPLLWVGVDSWRGSWPLSGFGWGTVGVTQVDNGWLVPLGRVLGEKGVTLVVVALSLFAWVAVRDAAATGRRPDDGSGSQARAGGEAATATRGADDRVAHLDAARFGLAGVVVVALATTLTTVAAPARDGTMDVLAVQANDLEFPDGPYLDDARTVARQALEETLRAQSARGPADLVVWPEGTVGLDPARDEELSAVVADAGAVAGGRLLLGTDLEDPDSPNLFRISAVVGADGGYEEVYRKRELVPFGEFVPFRSLLDWYPPLRQVPRDVLPGTEPMSVDVGGIPVAVGICFESMYPEVLRSNILAGPEPARLLVLSTSDSSYGRSGQPAQHVDQSRMRAIESGRWVVHATTSGLTTLVDPAGGLHGRTELFTVDAVRGEVGLATGLTPFLRVGDLLAPTTRWLVVAAAVGMLRRWRRSRDRDDTA